MSEDKDQAEQGESAKGYSIDRSQRPRGNTWTKGETAPEEPLEPQPTSAPTVPPDSGDIDEGSAGDEDDEEQDSESPQEGGV